MPSVTLKPVSLNDKTGGLRTTPDVTGAGAGMLAGTVGTEPWIPELPPPHALSKAKAPSKRPDRENEKSLYNMYAT
jgi:hypothetical protein